MLFISEGQQFSVINTHIHTHTHKEKLAVGCCVDVAFASRLKVNQGHPLKASQPLQVDLNVHASLIFFLWRFKARLFHTALSHPDPLLENSSSSSANKPNCNSSVRLLCFS